MTSLTEAEAIARYDAAGGGVQRFAPVRWPDVLVEEDNMLRLVEGALGSRCDFTREAFGSDFDDDGLQERIEEAWRRDAVQMRFAPEGVFVRAEFSVRVTMSSEDGDLELEETLSVKVEVCLSFSTRKHARPFIDVMGGGIARLSDGTWRAIDPFGLMVEPQDAVAWGLNGLGA